MTITTLSDAHMLWLYNGIVANGYAVDDNGKVVAL